MELTSEEVRPFYSHCGCEGICGAVVLPCQQDDHYRLSESNPTDAKPGAVASISIDGRKISAWDSIDLWNMRMYGQGRKAKKK